MEPDRRRWFKGIGSFPRGWGWTVWLNWTIGTLLVFPTQVGMDWDRSYFRIEFWLIRMALEVPLNANKHEEIVVY